MSEYCTCDCHVNPEVRHSRACCRQCSGCGKHITLSGWKAHRERCLNWADDECHCGCHRGTIIHIVACSCRPCPHCDQRIRLQVYQAHSGMCAKGEYSR